MYQDVEKVDLIKKKQEKLEEDIGQLKQAQQLMKEHVQEQMEGQEEEDLSDYEDKTEQIKKPAEDITVNKVKQYRRMLQKVVRGEEGEKRDTVENFVEGNQNLFKQYYERAGTMDKIGGLTEEEL